MRVVPSTCRPHTIIVAFDISKMKALPRPSLTDLKHSMTDVTHVQLQILIPGPIIDPLSELFRKEIGFNYKLVSILEKSRKTSTGGQFLQAVRRLRRKSVQA